MIAATRPAPTEAGRLSVSNRDRKAPGSPSLDELAADPAKVLRLPPTVRRRLALDAIAVAHVLAQVEHGGATAASGGGVMARYETRSGTRTPKRPRPTGLLERIAGAILAACVARRRRETSP